MWTDILFDLDGTLTDPGEGITGSVRKAMQHFNYPIPAQAVLESFVGPPLDDQFRLVCGFNDEQTATAITVFRGHFEAVGIHQNKLFPGIDGLLAELVQRGKTLHLATSKPLVFARQVLDTFGLAAYFTSMAGSTTNHPGRHKADVVREVMDTQQLNPQTAVMVGDRKFDVEGAHACGLPCVGLLLGYGGRQELEAAGAKYIAEDVPALRRILLQEN